MYTVYYALYVKEEGSVPYYYYNGKWTKTNPTNKGDKKYTKKVSTTDIIYKDTTAKSNTLIDAKGNKLPIQYYIISNEGNLKTKNMDDDCLWGYIRNVLGVNLGYDDLTPK